MSHSATTDQPFGSEDQPRPAKKQKLLSTDLIKRLLDYTDQKAARYWIKDLEYGVPVDINVSYTTRHYQYHKAYSNDYSVTWTIVPGSLGVHSGTWYFKMKGPLPTYSDESVWPVMDQGWRYATDRRAFSHGDTCYDIQDVRIDLDREYKINIERHCRLTIDELKTILTCGDLVSLVCEYTYFLI